MESVFCPEVLSEWGSQLCIKILACPLLVQYRLHTGSILIKFSPINTVHFLLSVGSNGGKNSFWGFECNISSPLNFHACVCACVCVVSSITYIEFRRLWATVCTIHRNLCLCGSLLCLMSRLLYQQVDLGQIICPSSLLTHMQNSQRTHLLLIKVIQNRSFNSALMMQVESDGCICLRFSRWTVCIGIFLSVCFCPEDFKIKFLCTWQLGCFVCLSNLVKFTTHKKSCTLIRIPLVSLITCSKSKLTDM